MDEDGLAEATNCSTCDNERIVRALAAGEPDPDGAAWALCRAVTRLCDEGPGRPLRWAGRLRLGG